MRKHTLILLSLAVLVGFAAFWVVGNNKAAAPAESDSAQKSTTPDTSGSKAATEPANSDSPDTTAAAQQITITYENGAFTPSTATLAKGGKITWVNKDSSEIQIGANPHPTHTGNREISGGQFTLTIPAGGTATSTLTTAGAHGYHNHLNSTVTGTVTVK